MPLSRQALHAFTWSAFGEAASRTIGPLVFLILARLLVPDDFGIVAAATVVISFSQIFSDAGLAKALIQRQGDVHASANVVFWLNTALGAIVVVLLLVSAPWIAGFFHDPRITVVIRVLSIQVLLAALSATHATLLQKELDFRSLFWVRLLSAAVPAIASVALALSGYGYWALVAGSVVGQFLQTALLWKISSWRPSWKLDRGLAVELLSFGRWAMLSGLFGWFYLWMDAVVVGHYLGAHDMGLYRIGNAFVAMLYGLVFTPMLPVLYTLFSRIQDDVPALRSALGMVARTIALAGLPVGFFLFVMGDDLARLLFGMEWAGLGSVIGLLGLMHACTWIVGANGEAYRAMGRPEVETWINGALIPLYLAGYLLAVGGGLDSFLYARLLLGLAGLLFHILVAQRMLGMPPLAWIPGKAIAVCAGSAAFVAVNPFGIDLLISRIAVSSASFLVIAATGLYLAEKTFVRRIIGILPARSFNAPQQQPLG